MNTVRYKLKGGKIIDAPKECCCITHDIPHWLYMDKLWKDSIKKLKDEENYLGAAYEDRARLQEKLYQMKIRSIVEILW